MASETSSHVMMTSYDVDREKVDSSEQEEKGFNQCDPIGRFLKIICVNVSVKISPKIWLRVRLFENITFQVTTAVATFWATFGKLWSTFDFNIWSHKIITKPSKMGSCCVTV